MGAAVLARKHRPKMGRQSLEDACAGAIAEFCTQGQDWPGVRYQRSKTDLEPLFAELLRHRCDDLLVTTIASLIYSKVPAAKGCACASFKHTKRLKDGEKQKPRFLLFDSQKSQGRVFQSFRKYQLGFVPPTVKPSMRSVG